MKKNNSISILRVIAYIMLLVGAGVSLWFVVKTGSSNSSVLLVSLFIIWVVSPFVILAFAGSRLRKQEGKIPLLYFSIIIIISLLSLAAYSKIFTIQNVKPAFIYLVVPFVEWIFIIVLLFLARTSSKKM